MFKRRIFGLFMILFLATGLFAQQTEVFVTRTGAKYHLSGCRYLNRSMIPIFLEDAISRYDACRVCRPPTSLGAPRARTVTPGSVQAQSRPSAAVPSTPGEISGNVVGISDGDTITILEGRVQHKIRFNGIDCPESNQGFGQRAKEYLSSLIFQKTVRVIVRDTDRYNRKVCDVYLGELWLNQEMVRVGLAWHYKQYSNDAVLANLENIARAERMGLWSDPNPVAPWDFRH